MHRCRQTHNVLFAVLAVLVMSELHINAVHASQWCGHALQSGASSKIDVRQCLPYCLQPSQEPGMLCRPQHVSLFAVLLLWSRSSLSLRLRLLHRPMQDTAELHEKRSVEIYKHTFCRASSMTVFWHGGMQSLVVLTWYHMPTATGVCCPEDLCFPCGMLQAQSSCLKHPA